MSKHKVFESPRWKVGRYEYRVSPTLLFTLDVGKFPCAMAHVGLPSEASFACYMVLPLSCVRSEQVYIDECERLAAQHPGVSALFAFATELSRERVRCERCDKTLDAESAGSVHDYIAGGRITVCDPCMDEPSDTHNTDECPRVFGAVCAHPDCARRDREVAAFKREMGAL